MGRVSCSWGIIIQHQGRINRDPAVFAAENLLFWEVRFGLSWSKIWVLLLVLGVGCLRFEGRGLGLSCPSNRAGEKKQRKGSHVLGTSFLPSQLDVPAST